MSFSSLIRYLSRSSLTKELLAKLNDQGNLSLSGIPRFPACLLASSLAQSEQKNFLIVCPTIEEAARKTAILESIACHSVFFYPTSESSPYEPYNPESEMIWGQMQTLAAIASTTEPWAIVATERALQPHLPPAEVFQQYCLTLTTGITLKSQDIGDKLTILGYERVNLVEVEGQWAKRGDLIDIFPVSAELPVRLEFFGDQLEKIREFDSTSQRSLDALDEISLTPTSFNPIIADKLQLEPDDQGEGLQRLLGLAFPTVASILDYLPQNTIIALDEVEQCRAHSRVWLEHTEEQWQLYQQELETKLPKIHQNFDQCLTKVTNFSHVFLSEIAEENNSINLASRPLPVTPHQFAKLAEILRGKRDIFQGMNLEKYARWLISAQPSRSVSLLQEHDCPALFIPNPKDYQAIDREQSRNTAIALKYSGLAELEGFILPTFRLAVVTDREFFGQHHLGTAGYIRKRRRATSKQVDVNKLRPGDYVVHKYHGIGKFLKLENLEIREYLVIEYSDGLLRVPADALELVSRYRFPDSKTPQLHKMSGKSWENVKNKVKRSVSKLAVDLLQIYAKRSEKTGYAYPTDSPWQQELEDSFPYQPTPDQLKAVQDVKRDLESDRPMDRLVCGDVGFGKTEVAIRAIFKAITTGNKQVAVLAPTTVLTQQHYHTLKERFAPYPITIGLLNRFRTASERKEILQKLATGELDIVVGTQLLLGKEINYRDLGLLVIDEEQRFGVNQKEKIKAIKSEIDVLTLTATPIPRTLYMSLSGIREMSIIATPPPSRRPIKTYVSPYNPEVIRTAIRNELDRGGQVFYVVPRIEGIEELAAQIREMIPSARIAIGHGQLDENELEATMLGVNNGDYDILVCTTIVESGLDIPRVNTIIIEESQKFGLSQLYQLRGRVGRSGVQAHAFLLYPNQETLSDVAIKRLRALQEFSQLGSGYQLAMRDMEIRGVGNILGTEQSGQMEAIGFELYMEMLQEAIKEIQGQEIPQVDDTQIDLKLTAFIPGTYISDVEQKMDAYRAIATASSKKELIQIAAEWCDRYGNLPKPVEQLLKIAELKQIAKCLGFSRIKPEAKQHIVLETPMEEPAWKKLQEQLPTHLQTRFIYSPKKVTVRGLGMANADKQLESLIEWLSCIDLGFSD